MSKKIIENTTKIVEPIVSSLGYGCLDIDFFKQPTGQYLTVTIFHENGDPISHTDCERVHNAINEPLDALDEILPDNYFLNVSSPGLDRPLKNEKDFKRNLGKEIEIKFYRSEDGKKQVTGKLVDFAEDIFTIETDGKTQKIDKKITANIIPVVDYKALFAKGEKDEK